MEVYTLGEDWIHTGLILGIIQANNRIQKGGTMLFGEKTNTMIVPVTEVANTAVVPFIKEGSVEIAYKKFDVLKTQSESRIQEQRKEKEKSAAERECKEFTLFLCRLAHKKFGFTLDALKQLTEEDLRVCIHEIRKDTKWKKMIGKGIAISLIPVMFVGWFIGEWITNSDEYMFEWYYEHMRKFYGEHLPYGFMQTFINNDKIQESFRDEKAFFELGDDRGL